MFLNKGSLCSAKELSKTWLILEAFAILHNFCYAKWMHDHLPNDSLNDNDDNIEKDHDLNMAGVMRGRQEKDWLSGQGSLCQFRMK